MSVLCLYNSLCYSSSEADTKYLAKHGQLSIDLNFVQFIITGFVCFTPDHFIVSSSITVTLLMPLPSFGQAAIQQGHMEGCLTDCALFGLHPLCVCVCVCVCVCILLTLTQLPRLRCLSSMQNVRMLRIAVCCRDNKEKDKERKVVVVILFTLNIFFKKSHSCLFGTMVISQHLLIESEINKKSGNYGRTAHTQQHLNQCWLGVTFQQQTKAFTSYLCINLKRIH